MIKFRKDEIIEMKAKHKIPVKETFAGNVRKKLAMVDLLYLLDWIVLNAEQIAEGTGDGLEVKLSYVLLNECVVQQNQEIDKSNSKTSIFSKESFEHNQNFQGVKFYGSLVMDPKTSVKKSKVFNGFFGN
jgi:putative ubiquitin-RnfH superfamily antitoxin RatB of RatAB toxin-antitoxin module